MKITILSALALGLAAQSAMALTVKSSEVANKIREVNLRQVRFEGQQKVVLTDAKGMSVYTFDLDSPGKSVCKGACLTAWPTVSVAADAQIVAPFGTITGNDGKRQLTLKGLPLYYYFKDKAPGDVTGHYPEWQLVFVEN
jgi:predicted lipoprotein with Yx(FWY)xxD motif